MTRITLAIVAAALWLAAPVAAHAAGLGRLTVLSPLGQPLNAEIEIVSLRPGEEDGLSARLASSEAFKQAGIDPNAALTGGATYTATVSGATDPNGQPMTAPVAWSFTTATPQTCPCSIWGSGATPAHASMGVGSGGRARLRQRESNGDGCG